VRRWPFAMMAIPVRLTSAATVHAPPRPSARAPIYVRLQAALPAVPSLTIVALRLLLMMIDPLADCSTVPKPCPASNKCFTYQCSGGNCLETKTDCNDFDDCTTDSCTNSTGTLSPLSVFSPTKLVITCLHASLSPRMSTCS